MQKHTEETGAEDGDPEAEALLIGMSFLHS